MHTAHAQSSWCLEAKTLAPCQNAGTTCSVFLQKPEGFDPIQKGPGTHINRMGIHFHTDGPWNIFSGGPLWLPLHFCSDYIKAHPDSGTTYRRTQNKTCKDRKLFSQPNALQSFDILMELRKVFTQRQRSSEQKLPPPLDHETEGEQPKAIRKSSVVCLELTPDNVHPQGSSEVVRFEEPRKQ